MTEPIHESITPNVPSVRYCGYPDTASGEPCRQLVGLNSTSGLCTWHDPEQADKAAAVRSAGGRAPRSLAPESDDATTPPPAEPTTLEGVCQWLAWVAIEVSSGRLEPKRGSSLTYTLQNLQRAIAVRDLEQRYHALEARLEAMTQGQGKVH